MFNIPALPQNARPFRNAPRSRLPLLKRTLHDLLYLLAGLVVAAVIAGAATAWRLSKGPLALPWAVPTLEHVVNRASSPLRVEIGDVILSWEGWDSGLDVRFLNVRVHAEDARPVAAVARAVRGAQRGGAAVVPAGADRDPPLRAAAAPGPPGGRDAGGRAGRNRGHRYAVPRGAAEGAGRRRAIPAIRSAFSMP